MKGKIEKNKERGIITMRKQRKKLNKRNNSNCVGDYNSTKLLPQWSKVRVCNVNK